MVGEWGYDNGGGGGERKRSDSAVRTECACDRNGLGNVNEWSSSNFSVIRLKVRRPDIQLVIHIKIDSIL